MPMPKRKPGYNANATIQEPLTAARDSYGDLVDDRNDG